MPKNLSILLAATLSAVARTSAFVAPAMPRVPAAERASEVGDEPEMNPDNPNLPALKGDYDWDAAYAADDDWITENVPGKMVVGDAELAAQLTALSRIEERFKKVREADEYEDARIIGWVPMAETYNGRFAMFFLVVGLLTEYWTGISIPGQIEEMARVGGFLE